MFKNILLHFGALKSVCRSLAADERGSVAVEMGFCSMVFVLLVASILTFGGDLSEKLLADLQHAKMLLLDLT